MHPFLALLSLNLARDQQEFRKSLDRDNFCRVSVSKTLNISLGKVLVSIDLKVCSLEKSRSRRNRKFESRKSLGLDNFH